MSTTTTQMGLKVPQINDPSPGYVNDFATSLGLLDAHDHTSGKGAAITQSAIALTDKLNMSNQTLGNTRSVQLTAQAPVLSAAADNGSIFNFGGDLYYLNGSNQLVQLTSGGKALGGIGGDYGASGSLAQVTFNAATQTYGFYQTNGTSLATGSFGPLSGTTGSFNSVSTGSLTASTTAAISGNATIGGTLNAVGGILQGSRLMALRGFLPASTLNSNGTNPIQEYCHGATPGFSQATFTSPFAGSIAGVTVRTYGATGSTPGGNTGLLLSTSGLSSNWFAPASGTYFTASQVNTGASATTTPGIYTFSANQAFTINVTSLSWTQSTTGQTGVIVTCWVYC